MKKNLKIVRKQVLVNGMVKMEERRFYTFNIGMKKFRFIHDSKEGIIYSGPVPDQKVEFRLELEEITDPQEIEEIFKGN